MDDPPGFAYRWDCGPPQARVRNLVGARVRSPGDRSVPSAPARDARRHPGEDHV